MKMAAWWKSVKCCPVKGMTSDKKQTHRLFLAFSSGLSAIYPEVDVL